MGSNVITIVTGANRGIGLGICRTLMSNADYQPMTLYACSREGLDLSLSPSNPNSKVNYVALDIASEESVVKLVGKIELEIERHNGDSRVVLINNAATVITPHNAENAKAALDVNYRGTLRMCQAFIPILGPEGRIVNVSASGSLKHFSPKIQTRFKDPELTLSPLEEVVSQYEKAVANETEESEGFGNNKNAYFIGKSCVNALTHILARENKGLIINAGCPGWVNTRMGNMGFGTPPKSLEEGARVPVRLAFLDVQGLTGKFWANESIVDTGDGQVRDW